MNIVCFQFKPDIVATATSAGDLDNDSSSSSMEKINEMNEEIVVRLQEQGIAAPSLTSLHDRRVIRVNITNHRTQENDLDILIHAVIRIGNEIREEKEK